MQQAHATLRKKTGVAGNPARGGHALDQKLLCTVQRQICIYFSQLMNSF
jgi:hypothetical protein